MAKQPTKLVGRLEGDKLVRLFGANRAYSKTDIIAELNTHIKIKGLDTQEFTDDDPRLTDEYCEMWVGCFYSHVDNNYEEYSDEACTETLEALERHKEQP